jgi:hypothetical protein
MWDNLSPADIERAKGQLKLQRDAILQRHAEELSALDADQNEIDALDRLITAFLEGREHAPAAAPEPEPVPTLDEKTAAPAEPAPPAEVAPPAPAASPAQTNTVSEKPLPPRQATRRDYTGTNFDTFSKAVSKLL